VALQVLLEAAGPVEVDGTRYAAADVVDQLLVDQYTGFLDEGYDAEARKDRLGRVAMEAVSAFDSGGWSVETLLDRLPEAAAGRHILVWSRDEGVQRSWETMGVDGRLEPHSLAVSVLNRGGGRGGGKLDPLLEVRARLSAVATSQGRQVTLEVEVHNPVEPGTPTYAENPDAPDVRFGIYEGILAVNLPGTARGPVIDGVELLAAGTDGPTAVLATRFELGPRERQTFTVRFALPSDVDALRIEPSARVPPVTWDVPDSVPFMDVRRRTVEF
jgi:hypothetical protein